MPYMTVPGDLLSEVKKLLVTSGGVLENERLVEIEGQWHLFCDLLHLTPEGRTEVAEWDLTLEQAYFFLTGIQDASYTLHELTRPDAPHLDGNTRMIQKGRRK